MRYLMAVFVVLLTVSLSQAHQKWPQQQLASGASTPLTVGLSLALDRVSDGHALTWISRVSPARGQVIPLKTYRTSYGQVCREYSYLLSQRTGSEQGFGTACQQSDGSWQIAGQQNVGQHVQSAIAGYRAATKRCPYLPDWHPAVDGLTRPQQHKRYHSEEFLRKHRSPPQPESVQSVPSLRLVAN